MNKIFLCKNFLAVLILISSFAVAGVITHAATSSTSVSLEKNKISGFFTLSIKASAGIKEFVLYPSGKSSYGGGLGGCQKTFKNDNISFGDPGDFTPKMDATITDCNNTSVDFELLPPKDGRTVGKPVLLAAEETLSTARATSEPSETKTKPENQILTDVKFPVAELGSCQSETDCISYCDDVAHANACIEFAKKNKIISSEEADSREKLAGVTEGPGGCNSQKSCETYCSDIDKMDECFNFADKHNLFSAEERAKIVKIKDAVKAGVALPGGCKNKQSCESYCSDADHVDECLNFGEQSGFLSSEEIQQYKKFSELRKSGETPGKCSSKESCDAYCGSPDNAEECINFAEKAGFLSGEELAQAKKVLPLLKAGKTPGACKNKQQCDAYCSDDSHTDECMQFGLDAGLISAKDAEMIKKTGGKGPGGCHSKEQCQSYCEQNQDECASWAKEHGLEGEFGGPGGNGGRGFQGGPGGCKSQEECQAYCQTHQEECQKFSPGGQSGGGEGDGGQTNADNSGFGGCITAGQKAEYICGINGRNARPGVETTYFNECHAKQSDVQILHAGVCEGQTPCDDIANPVCGNDGNTWVNVCAAEERGGVAYEGACKNQSGGGQKSGGQRGFNSQPFGESGGAGGGQGFQGGPGGCKSQEECQAYCMNNPDKCQGTPPPSGTRTDTGIQFQYQGSDHGAECARYGGTWDGKICQKPSSGSYPTGDQQQMPQPYQQQFQQSQPPTNFSGPGGCKNPEECKVYCTQNYQDPACQQFSPSSP
ncbi:MAG: hypothetical protein Q7R65_02670 [bacterium]|nr:hypothetical protein [bacterium]